jgi:hypothetical protein
VKSISFISEEMKTAVFWDVVLCSLVDINRRFRGVYCLHHRGVVLLYDFVIIRILTKVNDETGGFINNKSTLVDRNVF